VCEPAFGLEVARLIIEEEKDRHFGSVLVEAYLAGDEDFLKVHRLLDSPSASLVESIAW